MIGSLPLSAPELESRIIPALQSIEDRLMEVVTSADETINPPTSHLAEAGGKRLRPVLALLTAQLGDPALATGEQIRQVVMSTAQETEQAIAAAQRLAVARGQAALEPLHILAALLEQDDGIAAPLLKAVGADAADVRAKVRRDGSFGTLSAALATPLVLVLTELVQNAVEHAFPPGSGGADDPGSVQVRVERGPATLRLQVLDEQVVQLERELAGVDRQLAGLPQAALAETEEPEQVTFTAMRLRAGTPVIALLESALGIENATAVAKAPGTFRLAFGVNDFRKDVGVGEDPLAMAYARSRMVIASRVGGLPGAIDGPPGNTDGEDAVVDSNAVTASMGMTGRLVLNRDQVDWVNRAMSPSEDELAWARDLLEKHAQGAAVGDGSYLPRVLRAQKIADLADSYGLWNA